MEVWIMQSANRIGTSRLRHAGSQRRVRTGSTTCQKDMNPADPQQFARI